MLQLFGIEFGTLSQIMTTVFSGGIFAVVATFYVRNRQISVTAEATLRTHFGAELKRLADEVERATERQLKCESREEALRKRVRHLESETAGLKRQIARYSSNQLMILEDGNCPSNAAPAAVKSAERVERLTRDDEGETE